MAKKETTEIDLSRRRRVLGLMGAGGAGLFAGILPAGRAAQNGSTLTCVARPQQIEGPYFIDERLNRSDIRSDPWTKVLSDGEPLYLNFRVSRLEGRSCFPISGAQVDVWHCDAEGLYSNVDDYQESTIGFRFLRGYQLTDRRGEASFLTIYPGWYPGRTVHIHFKIRYGKQGKGGDGREFTSQIYFDDAVTDRIHADPPYSNRGARKVRNNRDLVSLYFGRQLMLPLRQEKKGHVGTFDIALSA